MKDTVLISGKEYLVVDVKSDSIWNYVKVISEGKFKYRVLENIAYYSKRYNKWIGVEAGDKSDGATSAPDIDSFCWVFHDELCNDGKFEGGVPCSNWQASFVLSDIMSEEGRWFRQGSWFWATWLFGGGKARDNGMF